MGQQNFAMTLGKKSKVNAGDELRKIEASKSGYTFKIVPYEEIRPSDDNKYSIENVLELKESIKEYGLLHNLVLMPIEDDTNYKYEIKSGEQRYLAIGELLEEGNTDFSAGVPSRILDKDTSETDQQIILEEANIKQRKYDPETMRAAIDRLRDLYTKKNKEENINISVTKQVAQTAGIGERQVQRYNAVTDKLIPELKEAFDKAQINLEKAAQFSSLDEGTQKSVVELLKINKNIGKAEIELVKKAALEKEELLVKKLTEKDKLLFDIEKKNELLNSDIAKIKEEYDEKVKSLEETSDKENLLRKEIEEELRKNDPNKKLIEKLQTKMDLITREREEALKLKVSLEKQLSDKDSELNKTKKELKEIKTLENKSSKIKLTVEEKKKLTDSFELITLINDIKKNLIQFSVKNDTYTNNYHEVSDEVFNLFKNIESIFQECKDQIFNDK